MSIDKRLISTAAAAPGVCTADTLDIFGDSSCVALYGLNYDASDASGNYNGTPTDVTFNAPGYIDYAASFNGTTSEVTTSNMTGLDSTTISLSAWVYFDAVGVENTILSRFGGCGNHSCYQIILRTTSSNVWSFATYNGTGSGDSLTSTATVSTGQWYHVVVIADGTSKKIYVNGQQIASKTASFSVNTSSGEGLNIGGRGDFAASSTSRMNGKIDQVRLFNKALSSSEVTTLYGEVACEYTCTTDTNGFPATASSDLAAYWKFDNDATDETGSYNGTLNGTNTWVGGRYGSSYKSNGSTGYISTSLTLPSTNYAFSYWAYNNGADQQNIIGTEGSNVGISMRCRFATNQIAWNNWNVEAYEPTVSFKEGWNHVVQQISSNGKQIYLNGSLAASNSTTSITNNSTVGVRIGGYPPFNYFSSCPIDQIRYYTKALSSTEVSAIYEEEHQCYITVDSTDPFGDGNNIALYEFENNANDSTGSYNGTASNVTYSTDSIIGTYSAVFNGSNSVISLTQPVNLASDNFTYSFWIFPTTNSGYGTPMAQYGGTTPNRNFYSYRTGSTEKITFGLISSGGTFNQIISTGTTPLNEWSYVSLVRDSSTQKIYINGALSGTLSNSLTTSTSAEPFLIGNTNLTLNETFTGNIDQVRIFDRALNGDEVWKLYAEGAKG